MALYAIQGWAGLTTWEEVDKLIDNLTITFVEGKGRSKPEQEAPPQRYWWDDGPGITWELRFDLVQHRDDVWEWAVANLPGLVADGTLTGYRVRRHDCNHDDLSVPEGSVEEVSG